MIYLKRHFFKLSLGLILGCLITAAFAENEISNNIGTAASSYDLVVYGDSSAAVTAAVSAKRKGLSVVLDVLIVSKQRRSY